SGDLIQANGARVTLAGSAQAKNIFWQVSGGTGVSIGTTAHMEGTILSIKAINLATGATANSRLLSQTEVTLQANTVVKPAL
ncbi:MAG: ice-binding family protein, partial [bacterium]|nr:ice-binding family protein [bacterium]